MSKLTLILLITALFFSCNDKNRNDYVILSGKVENPNSDSLIIQNNHRETLHITKLKDSHMFNDTLNLAVGFYSLSDGKNETQLYLEPGFKTQLTLNNEDFSKTVFIGDGASENNYLIQKRIVTNNLKKVENYQYYGKLAEDKYLALSDSVYSIKINLFKRYVDDFDSTFIFLEKNTLKYQKLYSQAIYETSRQLVIGDKNFKVSPEYYTNLFKGIDLSGDRLINISDYVNFVDGYIWQLTKKQLENNDTTDFYLIYLTNVEQTIKNQKLKQELAFLIGNVKLERTSELDKCYEKIKNLLSDSNYLKAVEPKYQRLKKITKGEISPSFKLNDINGKIVALEDLRGKAVYIDIWSTGCAPCMAEIPYLKQLEKYYQNKDIQFVSINIIDSEERWENIIKEKGLNGIQLYAGDGKISFLKDYLVRGIPRYILIDKEGRIIDSSAKRPSDPKLKGQIDKLI